MKRLCYFLLLFCCTTAGATEWQSLPAIHAAVGAFVEEKVASQPGHYTITVNHVDSRLKLARCEQLEPYQPVGSHLWGSISIGVRCLAPTPWSLYVQVSIKVTNNVLVAVRPIANGQPVQADDVQLQSRDITNIAGSVLTSPAQAIDKIVATQVSSGTILRSELLRMADVIAQGQSVKLLAQGAGFRVSSEGQAMNNAKAGQVVSVKTRSGQIIKGIAKGDGVVEVYF